jgi:hypothetical protein
MSSVQASVSVGDIWGHDAVERHLLVGATLKVDGAKDGVNLKVSVGAGQINFGRKSTGRQTPK